MTVKPVSFPLLLGRLISAATLAFAAPLVAQPAEPVERFHFQIELSSLPEAIGLFEAVTGVAVAMPADAPADAKASPVSGEFTPREALDRMLHGSGLSAEWVSEDEAVLISAVRQRIEVTADAPESQASVATFGSELLLDTPFSVNVVPQEVIESQRAFTTAEALKNDPSVANFYPGGSHGYYDTFGLRGFETHNWYSYWVDGTAFANQGEIPIENKQQVELLKGAAALQYGFAPPGGILHFSRKRATDAPLYKFAFDATSNGLVYGQADAGGRLGRRKKLGLRGVAAAEEWDSFFEGADGKRLFGSVTGDYRLSPKAALDFAWETHDRDTGVNYGIPISINGLVFDELPRDTNLYAHWSRYRVRTSSYQGGGRFDVTRDIAIQTTTAFNAFSRGDHSIGPFFGYLVEDNGDFTAFESRSKDGRRPSWVHQTHATMRFATGFLQHEVTAGFSWRRLLGYWGGDVGEDLGPSNIFDPIEYESTGLQPGPSSLRTELEQPGYFLTDRITFSGRWSALAGVRRSSLRTQDFGDGGAEDPTDRYEESATAPSFALMFKPAQRITAYGLYTEGLEAGGIAPQNAVNAFEQLPPLRSRQFEFGGKMQLFRDLSFETAFFRIEKSLELLNDDRIYAQDGLQVHQGLEMVGRGRVSSNVLVQAGVMFLDPEQQRTADPELIGLRPPSTAIVQGNLFADAELPWIRRGFGVNGGVYWSGSRYADNREQIPLDGYARVDIGLRYRLGEKPQYTLRLNMENATNARYFVGGFYFGGFGGTAYYAAPFTARASVSVAF